MFGSIWESFNQRKKIAEYASVLAAAFAILPVLLNALFVPRIAWMYFLPQCVILATFAALFLQDITFMRKVDRAFEDDNELRLLGGEEGLRKKYEHEKPLWALKILGGIFLAATQIYVFLHF